MAKALVPLFGSLPAEFPSDYSLEESVERLASATRRPHISSFFVPGAVGAVTAERVSLQRVIPMVGNSCKPFFKGSFRVDESGVVLTGRFTVLLFVEIWFGVFLSFSLFFATVGVVFWGQGLAKGPVMFLMGLGMATCGLVITLCSRWLARNDIDWLSTVIASALSKEPHLASIRDRYENPF